MDKYKCGRCGIEIYDREKMKKHIEKKTKCKAILYDIELKDYNPDSFIILNKCKMCKQQFNEEDELDNHFYDCLKKSIQMRPSKEEIDKEKETGEPCQNKLRWTIAANYVLSRSSDEELEELIKMTENITYNIDDLKELRKLACKIQQNI